MGIKKNLALLTVGLALSIATPKTSLEDIIQYSEVVKINRLCGTQRKINYNNIDYDVGYKGDKFYIYRWGSKELIKDPIIAKKIILGYNFSRAFDFMETNKMRTDLKNLVREIDKTTYNEIKRFVSSSVHFGDSWDLIFGIYNHFRDLAVDPKFLCEVVIGNLYKEIKPKYEQTIEKIDKFNSDYFKLNDIENIVEDLYGSDPYIIPFTDFLIDLRYSENPAFNIDPKLADIYKKIVYLNENDYEYKTKRQEIIKEIFSKVENTEEWKKMIKNIEYRRGIYQEYLDFENSNEWKSLIGN